MVTSETRNNLVVIIILVGVAVLVTAMVSVFSITVLNVAQQAEHAVHMVGKDLVGNISSLDYHLNASITNLDDNLTQTINTLTAAQNMTSDINNQILNEAKIANDLIRNMTNKTS